MELTFANLIDDGLLGLLDANAAMYDAVDPSTTTGRFYEADMTVPSITFTPETNPIVARAGWIGSASPAEGTWLWGWENINNFPPAAIAAAQQTRQVGSDYNVPELLSPTHPLLGSPIETAWKFAIVASVTNGCLPVYFVKPGGQSIGVILVDHPQLRWQAITTERVLRVITEAIATGYISDWHRALSRYAHMRGLTLQWVAEDVTLTAPGGGTVSIDFDSAGRAIEVVARQDG